MAKKKPKTKDAPKKDALRDEQVEGAAGGCATGEHIPVVRLGTQSSGSGGGSG